MAITDTLVLHVDRLLRQCPRCSKPMVTLYLFNQYVDVATKKKHLLNPHDHVENYDSSISSVMNQQQINRDEMTMINQR